MKHKSIYSKPSTASLWIIVWLTIVQLDKASKKTSLLLSCWMCSCCIITSHVPTMQILITNQSHNVTVTSIYYYLHLLDDTFAAAAAAAAAASCLLRALLGANASVTLLTPAEALRGNLRETGAVSATSPLWETQKHFLLHSKCPKCQLTPIWSLLFLMHSSPLYHTTPHSTCFHYQLYNSVLYFHSITCTNRI